MHSVYQSSWVPVGPTDSLRNAAVDIFGKLLAEMSADVLEHGVGVENYIPANIHIKVEPELDRVRVTLSVYARPEMIKGDARDVKVEWKG